MKRIINPKTKEVLAESSEAERISKQFDQKHDVLDTVTVKLINAIQGNQRDSSGAVARIMAGMGSSENGTVSWRFTRAFWISHMDEFEGILKELSLECENRLAHYRGMLSEKTQTQGRKLALQNLARIKLLEYVPNRTGRDSSEYETALDETGDIIRPTGPKINMEVQCNGVFPKDPGFGSLAKEKEINSSAGESLMGWIVYAEVKGWKNCPVTDDVDDEEFLKDAAAVLNKFVDVSKTVDGADMDQVLTSLKEFLEWFRTGSNTNYFDKTLSEDEQKEAVTWAKKARDYMMGR